MPDVVMTSLTLPCVLNYILLNMVTIVTLIFSHPFVGVMWSPGPSSSYSPPHIDWNTFMSHRPRIVAPDVSPLSSTSQRSTSPPKFSPKWSPHWSPQWSPDYSPAWEPMWSPQSSPEHMVEDVFQAVDEQACGVADRGIDDLHVGDEDAMPDISDDISDSFLDMKQDPTDEIPDVAKSTDTGTPSCSDDQMRGQVQPSPVRNQDQTKIKMKVNKEESVPGRCDQTVDKVTQADVSIPSADNLCDQASSTHSTSDGIPSEDPFRTPDYSQLKSRSGKRKAKLKNTPMKTAKCLDFTPADLPLDSAMSASPSHSSTRSSVGKLQNGLYCHVM